MFIRGVGVTYYPIGVFISVATGLEVTTGVPVGKYSKDGVGNALSGVIAYNAIACEWGITGITAAEFDGDTIGLKFTLTGCYPVHHTIKTYVPQAVLPANSITNDSLATSAITEIQAGLSVLTAAQVKSEVDAALAAVGLTVTVTGRINDTISSRAPADKALSTDTWNNARAMNLDYLNAPILSRAPADKALSTDTWNNARAMNLDNLNDTISSRSPADTALSSDIWLDDRADKLDMLDDTITSRAPADTALSSVIWTDDRSDKLDMLDDTMTSRAPADTALTSVIWTDELAESLGSIDGGSGSGPTVDEYLVSRIYGPVDPLDSEGRQVFRDPLTGVAKVRLGPSTPRGGRTVELDPPI